MRKVMISQPMGGLTKEQILIKKSFIEKELINKGYEVVDTFFDENYVDEKILDDMEIKHKSLWFLGEAIQHMGACDVVYFCKGWDSTRGCLIEHDIAEKYGLQIIYET